MDTHVSAMIGLFTMCVKHYSREEDWKRDFVFRVLKRECPDLFHFWCTDQAGPWMADDISCVVVVRSLQSSNSDLDANFENPEISRFLCDYSYEYGVQKRIKVCSLFDSIVQDKNLAKREKPSMQLREIEEPSGVVCKQKSNHLYECSHCNSWNTVFVAQKQIRSSDEPMSVWIKCLDCMQQSKVDD